MEYVKITPNWAERHGLYMLKKIISIFISSILIASSLVFATEDTSELKHDIFTYTISGDNITITGVDDIVGEVTVPNKINDKVVNSIGNGAFGGSSNITKVYLPDSVKNIGSMCFAYSTGIKTVNLSTSISKISEGMFYQCPSLMGVTVPYGVTEISSKAFAMCPNLTAVTIPNSTKKIANDAFLSSPSVRLHCYLKEGAVGYDYAKKHKIETEELITVYVNGEEIVFDQPPITDPKRFRTLVPLRAVLEKMGAEIEWFNDMNYAGIDIDGNRLLIKPNENFMMVNGKPRTLSSPGIEFNNRVLIPIRDVVESVGGKISWNEFDKIVNVTYNK